MDANTRSALASAISEVGKTYRKHAEQMAETGDGHQAAYCAAASAVKVLTNCWEQFDREGIQYGLSHSELYGYQTEIFTWLDAWGAHVKGLSNLGREEQALLTRIPSVR